MSDTVTLAGALRQVAPEFKAQEPPPGLRQRVLDAAAAAAPQRGPARPWSRGWSPGLACAAVLLGSALLMLRPPASDGPTEAVNGTLSDAATDAGRADGFLPLVPAERWPREAAQAWLVSTEIPGARLAALGLPFDPAHAGDSVRAELLVRATGEVLAVRLVH